MAKIEIYTKATCPYCLRAMDLLNKKGINYTRIEVGDIPEKRAALKVKANGRHTVPQIFINNHAIGGCDDLFELDKSGELDQLIGS